MVTPTPTTVQVKIQLRGDTAANWASVNPVLLNNELGLETDTKKIKVGNGTTAWNSLAYFPSIVTGGTVLGNLEIGTTGTLTFEGSTANGFETTLAVTDPTADRTITLPDQSGTVVVTGNASIVDADIAANAEIAVSKLADGAARQLLQTDAAGTGVEWTDNIDVPGTLDVTGVATFDDDVTIEGDLTVNGTTTTIDTETLLVKDKNIELAVVDTPTDTTADGGGITLKGATDKTITWSDATGAWTLSEHVDLASGKEYRIDGTKVLDATSLGSSVLITSTNITDGTIVDGDINASAAIAGTKISPDFGAQTVTTTGVISAAAGAAATPSITFTGDTNTGIYSPGADQLAISTGGTGRLFVDASGNVGLGVLSPRTKLDIAAAGSNAAALSDTVTDYGIVFNSATTTSYFSHGICFADGGNVNASIASYDAGIGGIQGLVFGTGSSNTEKLRITHSGLVGIGTTAPGSALEINAAASTSPFIAKINTSEVARIDSSGRLLVGTSSARSNLYGSLSPRFQVEGTDGSTSRISVIRNQNGVSQPALAFGKTRGATVGSNTIVLSGDTLGAVEFSGADGTNLIEAASITAYVDGTPGANDMPGRLVFSTTADGASSPTERMSISNEGYIFPDETSRDLKAAIKGTNAGIKAISSSSDTGTRIECFTNSTSTRHGIAFSNPNGVVGSISTTGSATAFNTSSDYRLKENVVPLTGAADRLNQLQVHRFNFIADPDKTVDGFLAHEAQAVVPECVTGTKDAVDDNGNPVYQGIDQSKLVPLLTAALQEALQKIETLEQRLNDAGIA